MKRTILSALLLALLMSCAMNTPAQTQTVNPQQEVARLMSLGSKGTLTAADLTPLKTALAEDESTEHELEEIEVMIKYQEFTHAVHGLAFLDDYLQTKKAMSCPGHELAHYYVFTKHGETELAEHALDESKESLPEWQEHAEEYDEKYPGALSFADSDALIQQHLASIEAGNSSATNEEIDLLSELLCTEAAEEHHHHE